MPQSFLRTYMLDRYHAGPPRPDRSHIVELDSLRGVAALFVVFTHFAQGWSESSPPHLLKYLFVMPFVVNGPASVMLFFVLSGFVLTLPRLGAKKQDYLTYAARRVCRIYLPYLVALIIALAGCWRFHGLEMYGPIFHSYWRCAPSLPLAAQHVAFLGRYDVFAYNPPTWSLVHEMRISLIFPLLCLISLRLRAWVAFGIALSCPVVGRMVEKYSGPYGGGGPGTSSTFWSDTIIYCGIFLVGSLLARYHEALVDGLKTAPTAVRWILPVVSVGMYQYPDQIHVPRALRAFAIGLGAAYFIILALTPHGWLSRGLRLRPLRFLGRISYSLYLIHVPILTVMAIEIWRKASFGYLFAPFVAISLVAAAVFHRFVEQPSIALGKTIGRRRQTLAVVGDVSVVTTPVA